MAGQREAKKAYETALYYRRARRTQRDARIQYRNLSKQQAVVGLVTAATPEGRAELQQEKMRRSAPSPSTGGNGRRNMDSKFSAVFARRRKHLAQRGGGENHRSAGRRGGARAGLQVTLPSQGL